MSERGTGEPDIEHVHERSGPVPQLPYGGTSKGEILLSPPLPSQPEVGRRTGHWVIRKKELAMAFTCCSTRRAGLTSHLGCRAVLTKLSVV